MPSRINKTYHIITIGCQMNQADSERLASFLESRGYRSAADFKTAAVIIINTCGVRQAAENRAYGAVDQIRQYNPNCKIVVTGCLSKREDVVKRLIGRADVLLPINEMPRLPELLGGGEFKPYFSLDEIRRKKGEKYLGIKPKYESKFTVYIPVGNGCNNFCSYCVVPYARGREVYRPAVEIIKEAAALVKRGYKEIILIAQNVNSYRDNGRGDNESKGGRGDYYDFPKLLGRLIKIPGKFWLRFSSSHPKDMSDELIKIIGSSTKVCPHLHLAVQSGDDEILKKMNRKYTSGHYKNLIKKVRAVKPGIAITTDVIVGFPGETRLQFANTVKLFKEVQFDLAYIARYSPRPGTASYKMKDNVSPAEKKRRARILNEILKETALKNNQKYLGKTVEVLVAGYNRRGKYCGKTGSYQTVVIKAPEMLRGKNGGALIGQFAPVKITKALAFGLEGELVK